MTYAQQIDRVYMQVDDLLGYLLTNVEKRWPDPSSSSCPITDSRRCAAS